MRWRTLGYGLLAVPLTCLACGSDDEDSSGGGGPTVPLEDVVGEIVAIQCNAIQTCAPELMSLYLPGTTCEDYFGRAFEDGEWPNIEKAIDDGRIIYHDDKAQACFDAWAALGCDMFTSRVPEICEQTLEGTVDEGGECTLNGECKGSLYCKTNDSCPGTCSPREAEGADCKGSDACQDGLACDDLLEQCAKPGEAGDSCQEGQPECSIGLICVGAEEGAPGTCKAFSEVLVGAEGDSCKLEGGSLCQSGLSCVIEDWTSQGAVASCQADVASGATCGIGLPDPCPVDEYCNADPQTTGNFEGTCTPLPVDGEPCVAIELLQRCAAHHVCVDGTCREMQRLDGACESDAMCYSDHCEGGTCAPTNACTQ